MKKDNPHLTIRINRDLRDAIKAYAAQRNTTVSKLTLDFYVTLLKEESKQEADQI